MPEQDSQGGGEAHQIRFVARTLDGVEVTSAPLSLKPGEGAATQARVATAYWGHGQYLAGDTAYACANAFGAEGAVVKFIVEKSSGGGWSSVANLKAKVKGEKAVATWPIPAGTAAGTRFRFKARTALNEQTALEFSVGKDQPQQDSASDGDQSSPPPPKQQAAPPPPPPKQNSPPPPRQAAPPPKPAAPPPAKKAPPPPPKAAPAPKPGTHQGGGHAGGGGRMRAQVK